MASDQPSRRELRRGMTVEVVQEQAPEEKEPIVGDVQTVLSEEAHPEGVKVELQSGAVGRVKRVVADDDEVVEE